jgi:hypothetical protein
MRAIDEENLKMCGLLCDLKRLEIIGNTVELCHEPMRYGRSLTLLTFHDGEDNTRPHRSLIHELCACITPY